MAGPLSSFLVQDEEEEVSSDLQAESLNTSEFLDTLSSGQSSTFLSQSARNTRYTDPSTAATQHDDFFTALAETTVSSEGFLASVEGSEAAVVTPSGLRLGSGTESCPRSSGGGSLLYLDPATGLHVLVHHMPHNSNNNTNIQTDDTSPDEFVVVGALQSEQEEPDHQMAVNRNSIVSDYEHKSKSQGISSEQILSSKISGTSLRLNESIDSSLPLQDGTSTLIRLSESGPEDVMDIDSVPHINLQKILEEIANRDNQQELVNEVTSNGGSITIEGLPDSEGSSGIILVECSDQDQQMNERQRKGLFSKSNQNNSHVNDLFDAVKSHNSGKRTSKVISDTSQGIFTESFDDNIDEDSLYDIVMTYRCKVCSQVFMEKTKLLQHYQEVHKPNGHTKIRVKTLNSSQEMYGGPTLDNFNPIKTLQSRTKELNILACGFCGQEFLSLKESQEHISQEHPCESFKRAKKGTATKKGKPHGEKIKYPVQPGLLIGHRKSRNISQEEDLETENLDKDDKRRTIQPPKVLQDQYWLEKQRPKPVSLEEIKKSYKCPIRTCKYKFSNEEKLTIHRKCHGGKGEERTFFCLHCDSKYDKWVGCQLHLWKNHQLDVDLLTCGICNLYKTATQHKLILHQKIHSDKKEHICEVCGKSFRQYTQVLNHQVQHIKNSEYKPNWAQKAYCELCDRWFVDQKGLKQHKLAIHLKVKLFECPECPYRCNRKYDLTIHMRQHSGERPYKCELCGLQVPDHNVLRRHKLTHLHKKPFKCPHHNCNFDSVHQARFKKHLTKLHPNAINVVYKCQICPLTTEDLNTYVSHSSEHEKEMVKEVFRQRMEEASALKNNDNTSSANNNNNNPQLGNTLPMGTIQLPRIPDEEELWEDNGIGNSKQETIVVESFNTISNNKTKFITINLDGSPSKAGKIMSNNQDNIRICTQSKTDMNMDNKTKMIEVQESNINNEKTEVITIKLEAGSVLSNSEKNPSATDISVESTINHRNKASGEEFNERTNTNVIQFNHETKKILYTINPHKGIDNSVMINKNVNETVTINVPDSVNEPDKDNLSMIKVPTISHGPRLLQQKVLTQEKDLPVSTSDEWPTNIVSESNLINFPQMVMSEDGHQYIIGISQLPEQTILPDLS